MRTFEHAGVTYHCDDASVGFASNGPSTAGGAVRRIRKRGLSGLRVLDVCCGVGVVGLTMFRELGPEVVRHLTLSDVNVFNVVSARRTLKKNADLFREADVRVLLSDGLASVPRDSPFDLIVSNPPHGTMPDYADLDEFTASWLGTADEGWAFHRHFYAAAADYLSGAGEVWFLENGNTAVESVVLPAIATDGRLECYTPREAEPLDESIYFWMLSRKKGIH